MAWLRIPPRHVGGLAKLQRLSDAAVSSLIAILAKAPLTFSGDELLAFIADRSEEDKSTLDQIIPLLLSLTALRLRLDVDASRLAGVVCEAISEGEHPELAMPANDMSSFLQRLSRLLDVESLLFPVKGPDVVSAHEYVFAYARVVSDIRPIFGSDVTAPPPAAAIVHTLQLTCHHTDGVRDFFVAMDEDDLSVLGDVVKRASLKAESLASLLRKVEVTVIGEREE